MNTTDTRARATCTALSLTSLASSANSAAAQDLRAQAAIDATDRGAQAFERLLRLAETRDSGQVRRVARFIAAVYNGQVFSWDPFELRAVDVAISNDMLACLDALRWGQADLQTLVPQGDQRIGRVLALWGIEEQAGGHSYP